MARRVGSSTQRTSRLVIALKSLRELAEVSHQRSDLNERLSQSEKATTVAQTQADEQRQSVADLLKVAAEEALRRSR